MQRKSLRFILHYFLLRSRGKKKKRKYIKLGAYEFKIMIKLTRDYNELRERVCASLHIIRNPRINNDSFPKGYNSSTFNCILTQIKFSNWTFNIIDNFIRFNLVIDGVEINFKLSDRSFYFYALDGIYLRLLMRDDRRSD